MNSFYMAMAVILTAFLIKFELYNKYPKLG